MTWKQKIDDTEDLETMILDQLPELSKTHQDHLRAIMGGDTLYNIEMDVLAKAFTFIFGAPVTFEEDGGPGGIISNILVHWDRKPEVDA